MASFLFGQILAVGADDVRIVIVLGVVLLAVSLFVRKELVAVSLDRETAAAAGLPVFRLDLVLYVLVTLAIVMSLEAVGNILVLALLIVPAATARLLTDRLGAMMAVSAAIGAAGSVVGLYLSYHLDIAASGVMVLTLVAVFAGAWCFAPQHGMLAKSRQRRAAAEPKAARSKVALAP